MVSLQLPCHRTSSQDLMKVFSKLFGSNQRCSVVCLSGSTETDRNLVLQQAVNAHTLAIDVTHIDILDIACGARDSLSSGLLYTIGKSLDNVTGSFVVLCLQDSDILLGPHSPLELNQCLAQFIAKFSDSNRYVMLILSMSSPINVSNLSRFVGASINLNALSPVELPLTIAHEAERLGSCNSTSLKSLSFTASLYSVIDTQRLMKILTNSESTDVLISDEKLSNASRQYQPMLLRALSAKSSIQIGVTQPYWHLDNIHGMQDTKRQVREMIIDPWLRHEMYSKMGLTPPKGVLLAGPPGTGKTLIAHAVAAELGCNFIAVSIPQLIKSAVGESERVIASVFQIARLAAPTVVFLDEIQAVFTKRSPSSLQGNDWLDKLTAQLLVEMSENGSVGQSQSSQTGVIVVGATNVPWALDSAVLRPGRFDRSIFVDLPCTDGRKQILEHLLTGWKMCNDESKLVTPADMASFLVPYTEGWTGADLHTAVQRAFVASLIQNPKTSHQSEIVVHMKQLEAAFKELHPSVSLIELEVFRKWNNKG